MDRTARTAGAGADALARTELHLRLASRGRAAQRTIIRWASACPELSVSGLRSPGQIVGWMRRLPTDRADRVLGRLVGHAQRNDHAALLAVLACLAPGIRSLAARMAANLDEVVSEVTLGILVYPVDRRSSVAGGLLLDARNRLHRAAQRAARTQPLDEADHPEAPGELGHLAAPGQRAVQLVCQAHREGLIDHTDAQLILHTRIAGHPVKPVARRLGLSPSAAYQRRHRAETRLTTLVA
jgi:hypothetical protein